MLDNLCLILKVALLRVEVAILKTISKIIERKEDTVND